MFRIENSPSATFLVRHDTFVLEVTQDSGELAIAKTQDGSGLLLPQRFGCPMIPIRGGILAIAIKGLGVRVSDRTHDSSSIPFAFMGPNGAHEAEIDPSQTTRQLSGLVLRDAMKQETGAFSVAARGAGFWDH